MLLQLSIHHLALIDDITIEFAPGFNVLTGETGAGKSIVVDAVNLVLGERAERDLIQNGEQKARVEALFDVSTNAALLRLLADLQMEAEDGLLAISRELTSGGRNICRVMGSVVPLSTLKQISALLLDIHGQHEHQSLLDEKRHLSFLDAFGGKLLQEKRAQVAALYGEWRKTRTELEHLLSDAAERERRTDMLRYQVNEIDTAKLRLGEEEELERQRVFYRNAERITKSVENAYEALYAGSDEQTSALDACRGGIDELSAIAHLDERYEKIYARLDELYYQLEDAVGEVRALHGELDYDAQDAEQVEERLDLIGKLRRKYGRSVADVLLFREKAAKDLDRLEHADDLSGQLKKTLVKQEEILSKASAELSRLRKEIAVGFEKKVEKELHDLGMQHAQFQVSFSDQNKTDSRFTPNGIDEVEFTMTANLGQPLRPLARVASGGELSRIMLAVKNLEAEQSGVPSMVFDEIDTGISGRMAQVVAEKMAQIAEGHQVICVTHLPQIAAMADAQYIVEKGVEQGKTRTSVLRLDDRGRSEELARMVGGAEATSESSLRHARTLLAEAAQRKGNLRELSRKSE